MNNYNARRHLRFWLFLCVLLLGAAAYGQSDVKITLKCEKITIKEALREIERQSKMPVAYNESKLNGNKQIVVNLADQSLEEALSKILAGTGFTFQVKNEHILIVPEKGGQIKEKKITGSVVDENGEPMIGVSLSVKGTNLGGITDLDGCFSLAVPQGSVVTVSYLGYTAQNLTVTHQDIYQIRMAPAAQELDVVVVTALGIKRSQKALSYNVQELGQDDITRVKDVNFVNALSGKVAGVNINASSSGVGGASKVVMRGTKGIEQSSNALYVIDGVPMFNLGGEGGTEFDSSGTTEAIADINPEDIESVSVLTGAAAAALYGSDAANGAVVITTKKGKVGSTSLTVSQSTEFVDIFAMPRFQNRYGTGGGLSDVPALDKSWGRRLNDANYMGYSPRTDYFRTGIVTTESITLSTGSEKNQTYLSAAAVNSQGVVPNNKYDRYNFTFRNTTSFLKDKLLLDVGASYIRQKDRNMTNQGIYSNPLVTAYLFPRGDDWEDIKMYERWDTQRKISTQYWPQGINEFTGQNPYWINYRNLRENNKDRYMMNANLTYKIFDWLSVAGRIRMDHSVTDFSEKLYATTNTTLTEGSNNGFYGIQSNKDKQIYGDFMVNVDKRFHEVFTLQANVGGSLSDKNQEFIRNRGPINPEGVPNKFSLVQLDNKYTKRLEGGLHVQSKSLFVSVELGYKSAYYLTLTGRNDWPSQLAGPHSAAKCFFYPSVGTSFILSEIFDMPEQVSFLKLRASFASVGLPFPPLLANPRYEWDENTQQYKDKTHYPMSNLKPERTDSWEVGLTARIFQNFNVDVSLYNTKSYNQTFDAKLSVSSMYDKMYVQTGSVRNRGIEFSLGYQNKWNDFGWSSNYTLSANQNKILELVRNFKHPETGAIVNKDRLDVGGLSQARFYLVEGGTLGDLYSLSDLQRDSNGDIYVDPNGNLSVNNKVGQIKLGSVFPKCNMAWRNNFTWKGLDVGFMISARIGGIVYSATQATMDLYGVSEASAVARDRGGVYVNGTDLVNAEKWYTTIGAHSGIPQYYTYSATNVRLQEASIGYTIPKRKLWGVSEVSLSLIGRNLWMIYNKAPFDPESVATTGNYYQGIDYFMMPSMRNVGFNIRFKF